LKDAKLLHPDIKSGNSFGLPLFLCVNSE